MLSFRNLKQYSNFNKPTPSEEENLEEINGIKYYTIYPSLDRKIIKLGYCCEIPGIETPIYIDNVSYLPDVDGVFEIYPKDEDETIEIKEVKIPSNFKFTLDLVEEDEYKYY